MSARETALAALFARLQTVSGPTVKRNAVLPDKIPANGLVIMRDGNPGEPDVTLNPRQEFYSHRAEIEVYLTQPAGGGGESTIDVLLDDLKTALNSEPSLGGAVEYLALTAPEIEVEPVEGGAPIIVARLGIILDYLE